ncbi:MAG: hypothetical protein NTX91_03395 [candidate division SR1 bacterium]|nr:hypothetical protein [candidate division SR1 bacterium]
MNNKPNFLVNGINTFTCPVPLDLIKSALSKAYDFRINDSGIVTTQIVCTDTPSVMKSVVSYNLPAVSFDEPVSYGAGCGDIGIWYIFDFSTGIVYIEGEDLASPFGKTG